MENARLARVFRDLAAYLEMEGIRFKPRAYEKAAQAIEAHDRPLADVYRERGAKGLREVAGIGASMAQKLEELLTTGRCTVHEEYRTRLPVDIAGLTALEGIGPKAVRTLYETLGIRTVDDLATAARGGKIRGLSSFGERSEQNILRALSGAASSGGRQLLAAVLLVVDDLARRLAAVPDVTQLVVAGSIRRRRETIGDADLLGVARRPDALMDAFVGLPEVERVLGRGSTRSSVRLRSGFQIDLRVVPADSLGAALLYFTGSKGHNVALRQLAIQKGLKLNEYGLFRGTRRIAGRTEAQVYERLGLPFVPPELREDQGEIRAALDGCLPRLIEHGTLRGDLQTQTDWTDGADSLEEMARAARDLGMQYLSLIHI